MKRVSFEVAKALKEVGYPITGSSFCYSLDGELVDEWKPNKDYIDAPTYLEVWLWLWREKNIKINILKTHPSGSTSVYTDTYSHTFEAEDPEEAIEKAIEFLVKQNLIK